VDVFEVALLHRPAADPMVKALARVLSRVLAEDTRSRPAFEK
ncbi:TPA: LysR family transcriptional regulator, partial [Pseudomonas aeruginosa]|nr:LysR family transcriptional regulator [Pseudomonas aeruginosa]